MPNTKEITDYSTDWCNIDLESSYERSLNILDPYSFDALLLEITCNLPVINRETVIAQFEKELQSKISCARGAFETNLDNIVNQAIEER